MELKLLEIDLPTSMIPPRLFEKKFRGMMEKVSKVEIVRVAGFVKDDSNEEEYDDDSDWDEDDESEEQVSVTVQVGNKSHKFARDSKGRFAKQG